MPAAKFLLLVLLGTMLLSPTRAHADEFSASDAEEGVIDRFLLIGVGNIRDQMIRSGTAEDEVDRAIQLALEEYASCYVKAATEQANDQNLNLEVVLKFIGGRAIEVSEQQTIVELDLKALRLRNAPCQEKFLLDTR